MLTPAELDAVDAAAHTGNVWALEKHAHLIRLLVAEARGKAFAFRPGPGAGLFLVSEPGAAAVTVAQRGGAAGLAELHAVVAAWPAWHELPGAHHAIDKRLRRAIDARIAPAAPRLAEALARGLDVRRGAARWSPPWELGRLHVQTT